MSIPRRLIDEVVTTHELEPSLIDVFVEGPFDADLLTWYFRARGLLTPQVYEIDTVDIGVAELGGDTEGQRQRVVALARALRGRLPAAKVSCVCDRDFENWLPTVPDPPPALLMTDFVSMDSYCIDSAALDKFLSIVVGKRRQTGARVLQVIGPILEQCFLIRLAHATQGWPLGWISPDRCCKLDRSGAVTFDRESFLKKLLQKNGQWARAQDLDSEIGRLRETLDRDARLKSHGHDFSCLLNWYVHKCCGVRVGDDNLLLRAVVACLDNRVLQEFGLFSNIESRVEHVLRVKERASEAAAQPGIAPDVASLRG